MRKSDLDFWQGMAAHYSKFMRRSAPIYAEICNHIRPHLTRDMNVLELACGTGQLSFPLSPYVRLWEATDASSKMIAEAKKQTGSSRLHFSVHRIIILQIRLICRHLCLMYIRQILRCQYSHQHCHDSYYNDQLY